MLRRKRKGWRRTQAQFVSTLRRLSRHRTTPILCRVCSRSYYVSSNAVVTVICSAHTRRSCSAVQDELTIFPAISMNPRRKTKKEKRIRRPPRAYTRRAVNTDSNRDHGELYRKFARKETYTCEDDVLKRLEDFHALDDGIAATDAHNRQIHS